MRLMYWALAHQLWLDKRDGKLAASVDFRREGSGVIVDYSDERLSRTFLVERMPTSLVRQMFGED